MSNDVDNISGWYIGRQKVTERRTWIVEVWATSEEDALEKFARGEGRRCGYVKEEQLHVEPVEGVHYDMNEGMGR